MRRARPTLGLPRRRKHRIRLGAVVVVSCLVAACAGVAAGRTITVRQPPIRVHINANGTSRVVQAQGDQTVTSVLILAGVVPRTGRLLAVHSHKVLDPKRHRFLLKVDGREATSSTPVVDGSTVSVANGADEIEGTVRSAVIIPPAPLPTVMTHVHHRGVPGIAEEVKGIHSGEVISLSVLRAPVAPRVDTDRVVALTFDDGPTATWTEAVLSMLASKGVKATFCEIGQQVRSRPALSRSVVAAGHQLCNHTLDHQEHLDRAPHAQVVQEIKGGEEAQLSVGLPRPPYYRPPGGSLGPDITSTAKAVGEQTLFWKVDTEDWKKGATPESILAKVQSEVNPGAIILMHDGGGNRGATVLALGAVIDWLRSQGYGFTFPLVD